MGVLQNIQGQNNLEPQDFKMILNKHRELYPQGQKRKIPLWILRSSNKLNFSQIQFQITEILIQKLVLIWPKPLKTNCGKTITSVKFWFTYKPYFEKNPSIKLSSGNFARFAGSGILFCNAGSCQQLISVHELHSHLWHQDDFPQTAGIPSSVRSGSCQKLAKGNELPSWRFQAMFYE